MGCQEADVAVDVVVNEGQASHPFRYLVSFESKGRDSATMVERKARNLCNRGLLIFNHIPVVCRPCHRLHRHLDRQDGHAEHDAHQYRAEDSTVKLAVKYGTPASTTGGFGLPQALDSTSWETQSSRLLPHHGCARAGRH